MKRLFRLMPLVAVTLAVSTALSTAAAAPTRAAANPPPAPSATISITQAATWYYYKPGHPMMIAPNVPQCTGAWAIRGTSGMFFLTTGHCQFDYYSGGRVYGTDAQFGTQRRTEYGKGMDALIVQPLAGVDAYQTVTARYNWPGGTIGNTVGLLHNANLHQNDPIGMSGWTSGWTTGRLRGQSTWIHGERVVLADYTSRGGDSGGPVLINDGAGHVWAAGMNVGRVTTQYGTYAAFISIDDLLARFGAWLPVFARVAAPAATADTGAELPQLKALGYVLQ